MISLMVLLLWFGVACVFCRHLHQTGSLTVDAMEESFQNNVECLEEDIADKVRASAGCREMSKLPAPLMGGRAGQSNGLCGKRLLPGKHCGPVAEHLLGIQAVLGSVPNISS